MTQTLVTADRIVTGFDAAGAPVILQDAALLIDGERIAAIGPADTNARAHPTAYRMGGRGQVIYHECVFLNIHRQAIEAQIADVLSRPATQHDLSRRRLAADLMQPAEAFYKDWH